jgi:hypothetical protein
MLWYKAWLETRWRFVIGAILVACSAAEVVFVYPHVVKLIPLGAAVDAGGVLGNRIREAIALSREYRGYVWSQAFRANLANLVTLFAALLGTGGLAPKASGGGLFTMSLPASRRRLLEVRATTGLVELLVLALVPSLLIPLLSPAIGERYAITGALVHALSLFVAGATVFSLALFLSTEFGDLWPPLLIALFAAIAVGFAEQLIPGVAPYGLFSVMRGELYFRTGALPWVGFLVSAALSALLLSAAAANFERRDF